MPRRASTVHYQSHLATCTTGTCTVKFVFEGASDPLGAHSILHFFNPAPAKLPDFRRSCDRLSKVIFSIRVRNQGQRSRMPDPKIEPGPAAYRKLGCEWQEVVAIGQKSVLRRRNLVPWPIGGKSLTGPRRFAVTTESVTRAVGPVSDLSRPAEAHRSMRKPRVPGTPEAGLCWEGYADPAPTRCACASGTCLVSLRERQG